MRQERTIQASIFDRFAGHEIGRELQARPPASPATPRSHAPTLSPHHRDSSYGQNQLRIRSLWTGTRLGSSVSYGMNGTSALTQMAIFREYVEPLRPGHVVWLFYDGNDLGDYLAERASPLLRAYFEPDHLQDLVRLSDQVSLAMRRYIDQQLESVEVATLRSKDMKSAAS